MLYLNPPFYFINGVMIYPDHADRMQYYYMPMAPRLRRNIDAVTGRRIPRIQLIKYRSAVIGGGGFANFDVHVGLEPDELEDLRSELRRLARLSFEPKLAPVPVVGGTVRLLLFGRDSSTDATPAEGTDAPAAVPRFVLKMQHAAKPSLYGDNDAAFSVQLDEYGAKILEDAMKGDMSPIGIVYSLDYVALRPAFSVRLNVDWDRVQDFLDESYSAQGFFSSVEIGNTVDKLIESRAIILEADNFVAEAEDEGSTQGRMDAAKARVQEMITDAFFESSLVPMRKNPDGWDKAKEVVRDLARGGGLFPSFSYKKQTYQRVDRKRLDVTMSERTSVLRTIYPQGHLDGLFKVLREGESPDRFIVSVEADDPWFQKRRVRVINRADMVKDGISSVQASLRYGNSSKDVVLDKEGAEQAVEWLSIVRNGTIAPEVEVDYTVNFRDAESSERPTSLRGPHTTIVGEALELRPRERYSLVRVPVVVSNNFPWERYPQVQVQLRYADPANRINMDEHLNLTKDKPSAEWSIFVLDPARQSFEYKVSYRAANNADVETPWVTTDSEFVDVRDPFPAQNRLRVDIVPVVPRWEDVEQMFVDVRYEDAANDFVETASLVFSASDKAPKPFVVDLRNNKLRTVSFRATTVFSNGVVLEVPTSFTEATRVLVRPDMKGRCLIGVRPPADFAAANIERISVELKFNDDNAGINAEDRFEFTSPGGRQTFEYEYVDAARDRYQWRARYLFSNGLTRATDWTESDAADLVLRAA